MVEIDLDGDVIRFLVTSLMKSCSHGCFVQAAEIVSIAVDMKCGRVDNLGNDVLITCQCREWSDQLL